MAGHLLLGATMLFLGTTCTFWAANVALATWGAGL
jgi:hypothetical protein